MADGFAVAGAGVGVAGARAAVRAGTGVEVGLGVGLEGGVGIAPVAEGAGEAGRLGGWREAARRWEAPEQATAASTGTSSTSAARRPGEIATEDTTRAA